MYYEPINSALIEVVHHSTFRLLQSRGNTRLFPLQMMLNLFTASPKDLKKKHPLSLPGNKARPPSYPVHILANILNE